MFTSVNYWVMVATGTCGYVVLEMFTH